MNRPDTIGPDAVYARTFADRFHTHVAFIVADRKWLVSVDLGSRPLSGHEAEAQLLTWWLTIAREQSEEARFYAWSLAGFRNMRALLKLDDRVYARTRDEAWRKLDPDYEARRRAAGIAT